MGLLATLERGYETLGVLGDERRISLLLLMSR
jgi:hypothetical protein